MSKYIIEYDETTGQFYDSNNAPIVAWAGAKLQPYEETKSAGNITLELVKQGMSADDIVKLKKLDLI